MNKTIYRFKFSHDFANKLCEFAKNNQTNDRKEFKSKWSSFVEKETFLFKNEVERLNSLGYSGDILDKMYKSARYYYRKKKTFIKSKENRSYQNVTKELLDKIDNHIQTNYLCSDYKPSTYFEKFYKENNDIIQVEILYLSRYDYIDINEKIKKTYKNRYYLLSKKL
jgi:hypothetical protein